jgi:diaminopimelate epimerase
MGKVPFLKMQGLGNDFVVLDFRRSAIPLGVGAARNLADRRTGIGCDQVILLEPPRHPAAQVLMRIRNADGSEAEACGNATLEANPRNYRLPQNCNRHTDGGENGAVAFA